MTSNATFIYVGQNVSSKLDTDQGEDNREQLKLDSKQMIGYISI